MQAVDVGGAVKVYDLCVGKTLPQWLSAKQRTALRKDEGFRNRIELVQDFSFKSTSGRIQMSQDGTYIVATGEYPPQVRVYDTRELSMKFERHLDAEVVQFQILSDDYTKLVFLGSDRTLDFHAAYGRHHRIRIPRFGRDLAYDPFGCELFAGAAEREVYRVDLEQGLFLKPFATSHADGVNVVDFSQHLQVLACGGADGVVSLWDVRAKNEVGSLAVEHKYGAGKAGEITALKMEGLTMACGTSRGQVSVHDIRSRRPVCTKQHQNDLPIRALELQRPGRLILSADPKAIKIWNRDTGTPFANVEPSHDLNDICLAPVGTSSSATSGLLFATAETERMMSFYIPRIGQAPKWASFLDNLTEELEEKSLGSTELYENYKFVQAKELQSLGVANLVGTPLLRAYMHGYFMDMRLYRKLKSIAEPMAFEDWRKEQVKKKMEKKRAADQRIVRKKPAPPKVNADFAERLQNSATDNRFSAMFQDQDFEIDQDNERFKELYPSGMAGGARQGYQSDDDDDYYNGGGGGNDDKNDDDDDDGGDDDGGKATQASKKLDSDKKRRLVLTPSKEDSHDALALLGHASKKRREKATLKRPKTMKDKLKKESAKKAAIKQLPGGNFETTFDLE